MNVPQLSELTLEDLLPHRGNMLFIDEALEVDSTHALTRSIVRKTWPLSSQRGVRPLILVELAAQAAGVCNGWDRIHTQGLDSEQMGWLVAIKKADFFIDYLPFGSVVLARAENTYSFANLREVSCELWMEDELIGKTTLQLFQANEQ